jgi:hypothetical protein
MFNDGRIKNIEDGVPLGWRYCHQTPSNTPNFDISIVNNQIVSWKLQDSSQREWCVDGLGYVSDGFE